MNPQMLRNFFNTVRASDRVALEALCGVGVTWSVTCLLDLIRRLRNDNKTLTIKFANPPKSIVNDIINHLSKKNSVFG